MRRIFGIVGPLPNLPARYNVAPTQDVPIVRFNPETHERSLDMVRWGLIPYWSKDASVGYKLINARAEGIDGKPSFRSAFKSRRCLIPADGFDEWQKTPQGKQPYLIRLKGGGLFAMAGLCQPLLPMQRALAQITKLGLQSAQGLLILQKRNLRQHIDDVLHPLRVGVGQQCVLEAVGDGAGVVREQG
jgi:putative SOS response-associated peptidase YedK